MSIITRSVLRDAASGDGSGVGGGDGAAAAAAAAAAAKAAAGGGGDAAAAAAKPDPFFKGLYGDDGKINKASFDRLPDHLKGHKDLFGKYETVDALLAGFGNAHSMAVKKAPGPLRGDEPPEVVAERATFLDTVNNVPKEAKEYGLTKENVAKDLPDQFWDQPLADNFAGLAKKHHLSPDAVKEIMALQIGSVKTQLAQGQKAETDYYAAQQADFEKFAQGENLSLDQANDLALRGAATLGIDPKSPYFKSAQARQACIRMTRLVSESRLKEGDPTKVAGGDELSQARSIATNPQDPLYKAFHDPLHADHERAIQRRHELYRIDGEKKIKAGQLAP